MKKVLITGANSYIGTSVEKYITAHYPDECEFTTLDTFGGEWLEKSFADYDVVFHVAGIAHQKEKKCNKDDYYKINRDLAFDVAKKAKDSGIKQFIFLSSMSVYGKLQGKITQDTALLPNTNYGKSKMLAENDILTLNDNCFKVCILRPPMVYGHACKGNYQTLRKLALKFKIFPYVKNERSMLYIDNLCEFIRLAILNEESGIFFPQNCEYTNTSEMVKMIAAAHGRKIYLIRGFGWMIKFLSLFTKLAKKAFGSLTYDKEMSKIGFSYSKTSLYESIMSIEHNESVVHEKSNV